MRYENKRIVKSGTGYYVEIPAGLGIKAKTCDVEYENGIMRVLFKNGGNIE